MHTCICARVFIMRSGQEVGKSNKEVKQMYFISNLKSKKVRFFLPN